MPCLPRAGFNPVVGVRSWVSKVGERSIPE